MNGSRSAYGRRTISLPAVALIVLLSALMVAYSVLSGRRAAPNAVSGDDTDALGITYASRLTSGNGASSRTRLFSDPADRAAQIAAVREDDSAAGDDSENTVAYAENKALFAVCDDPASGGALQCRGRNGYILHVALRDGASASAAVTSAALDRYGSRWARIFARYHPRNRHCALLILASDVTAEDETDDDDDGNGIIAARCYR